MTVHRSAPPRLPVAIERQYMRTLVARMRAAHALVVDRVEDVLDDVRLDVAEERRVDNRAEDLIARAIAAAQAAFVSSFLPSARAITRVAVAVDRHATREVVRIVRREIPTIDVFRDREARAMYERFARENVELIRSLDERYFDDVARFVTEAVRKGTSTRELAATLRDRLGVSENRARVVARDQVAKLNGRITQHRQERLGIRKYRWSTSKDERVRKRHVALEGKVFSWDAPPSEGHPGTPVLCRCTAIPVLD
jgi:SPP1 gp7 family putative phage head morphogenesis protein